MVSMVVGDFAYDLLSLHGAYSVGNPVDAGWLIAYVLIGVAALHSAQGSRSVMEQRTVTHDGRRLPAIALAGFISPVMLLVAALLGYDNDTIVLSVISITLFGLIILRMRWMFSRIERQSRSLVQALSVRESLEADLRHQAFHDDLTGLPNRALLLDRMEQALAASSRSGKIVAVCFCDLDGFKSINDSLGHLAGDAILVAASKRLGGAIRPGDTVARLGGDEFAVLMDDVGDPSVAVAVAERIVSILHQPVEVDDRSVALSVSVGVAVATLDSTAEQLLSEADSAMYEAKSAGRNRLAIFEQSMHARITERLQLSSAFQGALERDEFFLQYQPQFSLQNGSLQGFEALIRWNHPTLGVVVPDRFIPLAEATGNIIPIGRWVIEKACEQATQWAQLGGPALTMAVNISALQLRDPHLIDDVRLAIALGGLDPKQLVLEITESVLITDTDYNLEVLAKLKDIGVRLAIDDFGTGYSSLGYLRRMPIDELKIDKTFVDPLADPGGEGAAFVSTIIKLAHTLGLNVVAEGIEHSEQRQLLSQLGCDNAQGYLWARPMDPNLATEYVRGLSPLIDH
jgi:diguanylate cyclase (GGDEF)-like protein